MSLPVNIAVAYGAACQTGKAVEATRFALRIDPTAAVAHGNLGCFLTRGDIAGARKAYDEFFTLWKNADADVPVLIDAKKEYARLK